MAKEEVRKQFRLADLMRTEISELATHEPIPGERALAERFGTSRVTIRQALALLQDDGLIWAKHGAGGDAEKECVTDLTGGTGDCDFDWGFAHNLGGWKIPR